MTLVRPADLVSGEYACGMAIEGGGSAGHAGLDLTWQVLVPRRTGLDRALDRAPKVTACRGQVDIPLRRGVVEHDDEHPRDDGQQQPAR
jgi:hypothetical protein